MESLWEWLRPISRKWEYIKLRVLIGLLWALVEFGIKVVVSLSLLGNTPLADEIQEKHR